MLRYNTLSWETLMIEKYSAALGEQMGIPQLRVSLVNGIRLGCKDMHLVNFTSKGHSVSELIFHSELDRLQDGLACDLLEIKVRAALLKLKNMIEPE